MLVSSASSRAMYFPRAARRPALRALAGLPDGFSFVSTWTRGSSDACRRATSPVSSLDPSSMTMISSSRTVCVRSESSAALRYFPALCAGTTTDTSGSGWRGGRALIDSLMEVPSIIADGGGAIKRRNDDGDADHNILLGRVHTARTSYAPGVTRTPGQRFRKPLLYPPELQGRNNLGLHRSRLIALSMA